MGTTMQLNKIIYIFILILLLISCKRNPLKVDISNIQTDVEIVRFEEELFSLPLQDSLSELYELRTQYPEFFDLFTWRIINIGGIEEDYFPKAIGEFITNDMVLEAKADAEKVFDDFSYIADALKKSFKYYQYHFPEKELPVIYTMVSGFNQSIVTAENLIAVSLDKYLGRDYEYYQQLNTIPLYKIKNMHPQKIVSDVAYAWGVTEFDETPHTTTLLDNIIYQGKIMYLVDAMLPELHDSLKIGYTSEELEWCYDNEPQMWNHLVENKLLFTNKRMEILRFINDGPYTTGFPIESPSRSGVWIGWQIVRQYMKKHKEVTVPELMANTNYQQILNDSKYFPD